ncbi:MAG: hypothetical protein OEZ34_09105 [Spirochaetia bacterium]|nr:hypothetical protein [Spirochaetia bacterium]
MDSIELIKKAGAGLIIVILSVMMLITFSSQPVDEILSIIAGQGKFGTFHGKEIQPDIYYWAKDYCKRTYEKYGNIPEQFINNCAVEQLKQLYTLSSMGNKMGVGSSRKTIEKRLIEDIKGIQSMQNQYLDPDDRLSVEEIYRRELIQTPILTRQMVASAGLSANILSSPVFVPSTLTESKAAADHIKMNFLIVHYSTAELLQKLGKEVTVSEAEIKAEFERREKLKQGKNLSTFNSQRNLIMEDLKTSKKQKLLGDIKKELSDMKQPDLAKISMLARTKINSLPGVSLTDLQSVRTPAGPVNLAREEILSNPVTGGVYGPFQDGEITVYAELKEIIHLPQKNGQNSDLIEKNMASATGRNLLNFLIENEAKTGKFSLNPALLAN